MKKVDNILFLAGGKNERFWPLTSKNTFIFQGKPLIVHQLELYRQYTDKLIIVCCEDNYQTIKDITTGYKPILVIQKGYGQSSAILSAKNYLSGKTIIINVCDLYSEELIKQILNSDNKSDCIIASVVLDEYFPGGYLKLFGQQVKEIIEKPEPDNLPSKYFKLFIDYYNDISKLIFYLEKAKSEKDDIYETALTSFISSGKKVDYIVYDGLWSTVKYPWHILSVMNHLLKNIKSHQGKNVKIAKSAVISGEVYIDDNVNIFEFSKIVGPCYIGKDTIIGNNSLVLQSMVEDRCVVGAYSELTRSYLGPNTWLHRNYVGDSVLQGDILFGAGTVTANYRLDKQTVKSKVGNNLVDTGLIKLGAVIGKGTSIGINNCLMPGVKIAALSKIMPGEVVKRDIK